MNDQTDVTTALAVVVRAHLAALSPGTRACFLADLVKGYCAACGYSVPTDRACPCENDE